MPTLKEYIEEQRRLAGATPEAGPPTFRFTNIPGAVAPGTFAFDEEEFTAETERMLEEPGGGLEYTPEKPYEFGIAEAERKREIPPKPTAETIVPGGEIPEEVRKKYGLSPEAHYAIEQKVPEKPKIPEKPPDEVLTPAYKDRMGFRDHLAKKIEQREGVNPLTYNYLEAVEKAEENLPKIFRATFGGRVAWHMKDDLNPQQKKIWDEAKHDYFAKVENQAKFLYDRANKALKFGMQQYDKDQKRIADEVAKVPEAVRNAISSLYVRVDEAGKKIGQIPGPVLADAIVYAESMVKRGASSSEAALQTSQELTQRRIQEQETRQKIDAALAEIEKPGFVTQNDIKIAKVAAQKAMDAGGSLAEIRSILLDRGFKEKHVTQITSGMKQKPAAPPAAPSAPGAVPRGTTQYASATDVRDALRRGDFGPPDSAEARAKAKQELQRFFPT